MSTSGAAQGARRSLSAVTYYFPTVGDVLVAARTVCNDDHLERLAECAAVPDPPGADAVHAVLVHLTGPGDR